MTPDLVRIIDQAAHETAHTIAATVAAARSAVGDVADQPGPVDPQNDTGGAHG
jgi:hypothetical protein